METENGRKYINQIPFFPNTITTKLSTTKQQNLIYTYTTNSSTFFSFLDGGQKWKKIHQSDIILFNKTTTKSTTTKQQFHLHVYNKFIYKFFPFLGT